MKCEDIQQWLSEYWDWPEEEIRRHQVNHHIRSCSACREEFRMWQESAKLIQDYSEAGRMNASEPRVTDSVMNRIYADEAWRIPIPHRTYNISYRMRKIMTLMMAFFLAVFVVSLFHSLTTVKAEEPRNEWMTIAPVAQTINASILDAGDDDAILQGVPIASISDPLVLRIGTVNPDPNYWIAFSLLGIVSIILTMIWLSRVRS